MRRRTVLAVLAAGAVLLLLVAPRLVGDHGAGSSWAGAGSCAHPVLTTSADRTWDDAGFVLDQDMWNNHGGRQTLRACSFRSWVVTATQADTVDVNTYPNVHRDFDEPRLSSFSRITSRFATHGPAAGTYEFAYDVWLNGVAGPASSEVMIWTDTHGNQPHGARRGVFVSHGIRYATYRSGRYMAFIAPSRDQGRVDLLAFFRYAVARGWLPPTSTLGQIDFGVEICSTDDRPLDFAVTDFALTAR